MPQTEFTGMLLVGLALLIGIITPVLKLNASIVKLTTTIDCMLKNDETRDERLKKHGEQIDENRHELVNHEGRIKSLENKER